MKYKFWYTIPVIITINIHSLSDICQEVTTNISKEIKDFHYMTYMATPDEKNPYPGGHEMHNYGTHFLGHQYYILSFFCL